MNPVAWLDSEFCARLMLSLGHFLWQGAALLLLALVAARLLRRASARARYGVLGMALLMMAVCPPTTFLLVAGPERTAAAPVIERDAPSGAAGIASAMNMAMEPAALRDADVERGARSSSPSQAGSLANVKPAREWQHYAPYAVMVYLAGVVLMVGRLLLALGGGRRLKRRARQADDTSTLTALARQARALGLRFTPAIAYCQQVAVPSVVGVLRPMVLLPLAVATNMTPEQIEVLLAHELAHIRRYDHVLNVLQRLIEATLFFHPAVWVISKRIRLEREHCCDDLVLAAGGRRWVYAESLVRVAELSYQAESTLLPMAAALGATGAHSELGRRIARLIGGQSDERLLMGHVSLLAIPAVVVAALMLPGHAPARSTPTATQPATQPVNGPHLDLTMFNAETGKALSQVQVDYLIDRQQGSTVTDADGHARIDLPAKTPDCFSLVCVKERFVCMGASWFKRHYAWGIQPALTIEMEPSTSIGGLVKNEEGRPIQDAEVALQLPGMSVEKGHAVYPRLCSFAPIRPDHTTLTEFQVKTDTEGRWRCDVAPSRLNGLRLRLTHGEYVSDVDYGQWPTPPAAALRKLDAVSVMKKGLTIAGTVRNGKGEPVAGASVSRNPHQHLRRADRDVETDAEGRFRFSHVQPGTVVITVRAQGYAPELTRLDASVSPPPVNFRLEPGHTIKGRVVDQQGKPVEGVSVQARKWRGDVTLAIQRTTDGAGRFTVTDAPKDEILFDMSKAGYFQAWNYGITASESEQLVVLKPELRVHGKVVDAETKLPIQSFSMVPGYSYPTLSEPSWERAFAKALVGGEYECVFNTPREGYFIRIEAPGYAPAVSGEYTGNESAPTRDFELKKASGLEGMVKDPDGKPLAGAQVIVGTRGVSVAIHNGRPMYPGDQTTVVTSADGRFSLPALESDYALVVIADGGFAEVNRESFAAQPEVTIQRWGRIEGKLLIGARPGSQEELRVERVPVPRKVVVKGPIHSEDMEGVGAFFQYRTQTDAEGRFVIERLVPGTILVGREVRLNEQPGGAYMAASSHTVPVEVKPGKTVRVQIGGQGRPVVGRAKLVESAEERIDWAWGMHRLEKQPTGRKPISGLLGLRAPPEQPELEPIPFKLAPDGSFRIEDVPAGKYTLKLMVIAPPEKGRVDPNRTIAKAEKQVVVPAMASGRSDEPLDVGTIEMGPR